VHVVVAGVGELGLVLKPSAHSVHQGREIYIAVGHDGEETDKERHLEQWLDLVRYLGYEALDSEVQQDATEEGGEVEGWIVVVDVEGAVHDEEWEVVESPGTEERTSSSYM